MKASIIFLVLLAINYGIFVNSSNKPTEHNYTALTVLCMKIGFRSKLFSSCKNVTITEWVHGIFSLGKLEGESSN